MGKWEEGEGLGGLYSEASERRERALGHSRQIELRVG